MTTLDSKTVLLLFAQPHLDGSFQPPVIEQLRSIGLRKNILLLPFAPKAAGTFIRHAAVYATGAQLMRLPHALGGRDGTPYLPNAVAACLDDDIPAIIWHIHMQALTANRHFIGALGIKPVIMLRNLTDLLTSFLEMLESDPAARAEGLNCTVPSNFVTLSRDEKLEFMITMIAPWYASYFATWKDFCDQAPESVWVMRYPEFRAAPAQALHAALSHAGFRVPLQKCQDAFDRTWRERQNFRFNRGEAGRGRDYFTPEHRDRLARMLAAYPQLEPWLPELLEGKNE